jgi:hypothetical protein
MISEQITGREFTCTRDVLSLLSFLGYNSNFCIKEDYLEEYGSNTKLEPHEFKVELAFQDHQTLRCKTFIYAIRSVPYKLQGIVIIPEYQHCDANTQKMAARLKLKTIAQILYPNN